MCMCARAYVHACGIDPYIQVWVWAHLWRSEKALGVLFCCSQPHFLEARSLDKVGAVLSGWLKAGRVQPSSFLCPTQCCSDKRAPDHVLPVRWAHGSELLSFLCSNFPEPLDQVSSPFTGFLKLKISMVSVLVTFFIAATKYLKKE